MTNLKHPNTVALLTAALIVSGLLLAHLVKGQTTTTPAPLPAYTTSGVPLVNPGYQTYIVGDPVAFRSQWLGYPNRSLIFRNGLMITPNFDYNTYGAVFQVTDPSIATGDRITVVTFAP